MYISRPSGQGQGHRSKRSYELNTHSQVVRFWLKLDYLVWIRFRLTVTAPHYTMHQRYRASQTDITDWCWHHRTSLFPSLPRQHLSYSDCLKVKREYYQNAGLRWGASSAFAVSLKVPPKLNGAGDKRKIGHILNCAYIHVVAYRKVKIRNIV